MEEFRLQYPLSSESLILDAGVYRGDSIHEWRAKWNCTVIGFEPAQGFFAKSSQRFATDSCVSIHNYGLGARNERLHLAIQDEGTSFYFEQAGRVETATMRDVAFIFDELKLTEVDLFKINIEGGEYELLPRMLDADLARRVRFFQVQYHSNCADLDGPAVARDRIRQRLSKTHREEWCWNGGAWESWARV
jgi:FkbM family methyltransferase